MPCCNTIGHADTDERSRQFYQNRRVEEDRAKRLRQWLTDRISNPSGEETEIGKLCHAIRNVGEDRMLEIVRESFYDPSAREIAGWWEMHKEYDKGQGR